MSVILLAMSGGVDSTMSAKELLCEGHDVIGITMVFVKDLVSDNIADANYQNNCTANNLSFVNLDDNLDEFIAYQTKEMAKSKFNFQSPNDVNADQSEESTNSLEEREYFSNIWSLKSLQSAKEAAVFCQEHNIKHYTVNLHKEFSKTVLKQFFDEYTEGRTPCPCAFCNENIKFGILLKYAKELGADFLATGHYASLMNPKLPSKYSLDPNNYASLKDKELENSYKVILARGIGKKDQSYFLAGLSQKQLSKVLFPLWNLAKDEVVEKAKQNKFVSAFKGESQDLCFIPNGYTRRFLKAHIQFKPGNIVNSKGKVLGKHLGLPMYTIGQRKGLGIAYPEPLYVTKIDFATNSLVAGPESELYKKKIIVNNLNLLVAKLPHYPVTVQWRSTMRGSLALVKQLDNSRVEVEFLDMQRSLAPGQRAVFYKEDRVLGGGYISQDM